MDGTEPAVPTPVGLLSITDACDEGVVNLCKVQILAAVAIFR